MNDHNHNHEFNSDLVKDIAGWSSEDELNLLYKFSSEATGPIVEIGSWMGRSTIALAEGSKISNQKVYAVDTFHGGENTHELDKYFSAENPDNIYQKFQSNIKRADVADQVIVKRGLSIDVVKQWNNSIGMIFIDGDHSYKAVLEDGENWLPFLQVGGIAAFHDFRPNPKQGNYQARIGVMLTVTDLIIKSDNYEFVDFVGLLYIAKKVK